MVEKLVSGVRKRVSSRNELHRYQGRLRSLDDLDGIAAFDVYISQSLGFRRLTHVVDIVVDLIMRTVSLSENDIQERIKELVKTGVLESFESNKKIRFTGIENKIEFVKDTVLSALH